MGRGNMARGRLFLSEGIIAEEVDLIMFFHLFSIVNPHIFLYKFDQA